MFDTKAVFEEYAGFMPVRHVRDKQDGLVQDACSDVEAGKYSLILHAWAVQKVDRLLSMPETPSGLTQWARGRHADDLQGQFLGRPET